MSKRHTREGLEATPKADLEKLTAELGLTVKGTGANGNVVKGDLVDAFLAHEEAADAPAPESPAEAEAAPGSFDAGEADEQLAELDVEDLPRAGERVEIQRQNEGTWWCPVCDHSMPHGFNHCPKCLSERDGDEVVVHAAR